MAMTSTVGQLIKSKRDRLRLSQEQFIRLFNSTNPKALRIAHQANLSRYECGRRMPSAGIFLKIMQLGVDDGAD
jgi:transcriptional regulator with XRE-family HTH domain